jgi:HSP20 family protein
MLTRWTAPMLFDPVRFLCDLDRVAGTGASWAPKAQVNYEDRGTTISLDVPGIKPDQLEVLVDGNTLTIKGSRPGHGSFTKSYDLPESTDTEKLEARVEDGVLTVLVPKLPRAQPRVIPISHGKPQVTAD